MSSCEPRTTSQLAVAGRRRQVTNARYVLLRAEDYERMRARPEPDHASSMYPLLADIAPEDWEDVSHYENRS